MSSVAALIGLTCLLATPPAAQSPGTPGVGPIHLGPILLTGYAQFDGLFPVGEHDVEHTGTFRVRRARVYASADLTPKIGFTLGVDVTDSMPLRDAYVAFRPANAFNVRVGQFVAPFSLERLTSTRDLEAIDRVIDRLVPSRDMGAMVFNNRPFWNQLLYSIAVVNGTGQNTRDNNDAKDLVGRVLWRMPPFKAVSIGVNGASGRQPLGTRTRWGADLNIERGDYRFAAEYVHQAREWGALTGHGFYVLARRRFRPSDKDRPDFGEAVVRLVEIRDPSEIAGDASVPPRREFQAGGNYYFSRNARVMVDVFVPIQRPVGTPRATFVSRVQFMF